MVSQHLLKQLQDMERDFEARIAALEAKVEQLSKPHGHDDLRRY